MFNSSLKESWLRQDTEREMCLNLLLLPCNSIKCHFFQHPSLPYLNVSYDNLFSSWHSVLFYHLSVSIFLTHCPISSFTPSLNSSLIFFSLEIQPSPHTQKQELKGRKSNACTWTITWSFIDLFYFTFVPFPPNILFCVAFSFFFLSLSLYSPSR